MFDTIFRETRDIMEYQAEKENVEKLETEEKLVSQAVQVLSAWKVSKVLLDEWVKVDFLEEKETMEKLVYREGLESKVLREEKENMTHH